MSKIALVTTTINVPHVLKLYRKYGPNVEMFVAVERDSPISLVDFLQTIDRCHVVFGYEYSCSELIGWRTIQRRNLALLEAVKWGADIIVSVDDDNTPLSPGYFHTFERLLTTPFFGLKAGGQWFNPGGLTVPPCLHRGLPFHCDYAEIDGVPAIGQKVGVAAGLWVGDPDIGAVSRAAGQPLVKDLNAAGRAGVIVDPVSTTTVFNSQNTAFVRELAPLMMMWTGVGRYDDIFASLLCQCYMAWRGMCVHFGPPVVCQARNPHTLQHDLEQEMYGMKTFQLLAFCLLRHVPEKDDTALTFARKTFESLADFDYVIGPQMKTALAFCDDMEQTL
ncbi:MAG: hypothetical protein C5B50_00725 [Verrucomicrobia bacterium]|nr:MAG: hypothetical protein C5B50_00725 [Verrucomicrobiota bacterium]